MVWLSVVTLLVSQPNDTAVETPSSKLTSEQLQLVELQLQGMKDSRDRLVSGVFRASGRKRLPIGHGLPDLDDPVEYYCAFDHGAELFRFDREESIVLGKAEDLALHQDELPPGFEMRILEDPVKGGAGGKLAVVRERGKYVRTPEFSLHWSVYQPQTVMRRSSEAEPRSASTPFDVRCFGLLPAVSLQHNLKFPELWTIVCEQEVVDVAEMGSGVCRLVWAFGPSGIFKRTVWFDENRGYSPIRMEIREGDLSTEPIETSEVGWIETSGVWVPQTLVMEEFQGQRLKLELAFEWKSVNESLPEKLFSPAGLDVPAAERTQVLSDELGKPVILGHAADKEFQPLPKEGSANGMGRIVAVVASVVGLIALLLATVLVRRYRAAHPT